MKQRSATAKISHVSSIRQLNNKLFTDEIHRIKITKGVCRIVGVGRISSPVINLFNLTLSK